MTCQFNFVNISDTPVDENILRVCAEEVCKNEKLVLAEINLLLCDDAQMKRYHRIYRGCDEVTDVLSFRSEPNSPETGVESDATPSNDIIIDINQIERQKGTNSFEQELMEVFIHGLLHICGYDHICGKDREIMQNKEKHYCHIMEGER